MAHTIRFCGNPHLKGKMSNNGNWREYNKGIRRYKSTPEGLSRWIQNGYSFMPIFENERTQDNFVEAWHFCLDFDTGSRSSSIRFLKNQKFIADEASFIYSTPSSTRVRPRSRVVFVFDAPFKDGNVYAVVCQMLTEMYPKADQSCKNRMRLFYGSPDCEISWLGNVMDRKELGQQAKDWYEARQDREEVGYQVVTNASNRLLESIARKNIDKITTARDGEKHYTLNKVAFTMGGYVGAGYYTKSDVISWLDQAASQMQNVKSVEAAKRTIRGAVLAGMQKPFQIATNLPPNK